MHWKFSNPPFSSLTCRRLGVEERLRVYSCCLIMVAFIIFEGGGAVVADPGLLPQHPPALEEADHLLRSRKWADASLAYRSILQEDPDSPLAVVGLSKALTYLGRREEALGILNQVIDRNVRGKKLNLVAHSRVLARSFMGNSTFQIYQDGLNLLFSGKARLAREKFLKALESEPGNAEILLRIGQTFILEHHEDAATEYLKTAKKLSPYEPEIQLWLGRTLYFRGEVKEAILELQAARRAMPRSELAPIWLSEALISGGKASAAVRLLEEDSRLEPFHVRSLIQLVKYRLGHGSLDQQILWSARKELQIALSRLKEYSEGEQGKFEGDLGVRQSPMPDALRSEIQSLFRQVETRIQAKNGAIPAKGT